MQRLRGVVILCIPTALAACVDSSAGLAPEITERDDAALETAATPTVACTTFAGTWQSDATTFATAIAPATQVDLGKRANGTQPTAGQVVPRDEYLSCCGIRLDYVGQPGGRLIWTTSTSGIFIKGKCPPKDECSEPTGVRVTFVPATTAAGAVHPTDVTIFDAQNTQISMMNSSQSLFLGYQSAVPIDHAEFKHIFGGLIQKVIYHRCL
jgi:hypothetical protein